MISQQLSATALPQGHQEAPGGFLYSRGIYCGVNVIQEVFLVCLPTYQDADKVCVCV